MGGPDPGWGAAPDASWAMPPVMMGGSFPMMGGMMGPSGGLQRPGPPENRSTPSTGGYGTSRPMGGGSVANASTATGGYGSGSGGDGYGGRAPTRGYGQSRYGPY
jgi:hypothetical protein